MTELSKKSIFTKNIKLLAFISLFTDVASEMLYPVIPLFLKEIGYGVIVVGIIEGIADAFAGISKGYFGYLSDKSGNRTLFIRMGYGLSAISKPIMGFLPVLGVIFSMRLLDRVGKGLRTAPRDAILATESTSDNRGKIFGFHRSMDTVGSTLGPIFALLFLYFYPSQYRALFFLVAIPGFLAVVLTFLVKTQRVTKDQSEIKGQKTLKSFSAFWKQAPSSYRTLLTGFFLLALLNSTDMLLLLRAKELGMNDVTIITAYMLYNAVIAFFAFPLGFLGDKFGFKKVTIVGLLIFAIVYGSFARELTIPGLLFIIGLYGVFTAMKEALPKAWLSKYLTKETQGTGLGLYMTGSSVAFLISSIVTAAAWQIFGAAITFATISMISLLLVPYFIFVKLQPAYKAE